MGLVCGTPASFVPAADARMVQSTTITPASGLQKLEQIQKYCEHLTLFTNSRKLKTYRCKLLRKFALTIPTHNLVQRFQRLRLKSELWMDDEH